MGDRLDVRKALDFLATVREVNHQFVLVAVGLEPNLIVQA
jgi:hypothetical protein